MAVDFFFVQAEDGIRDLVRSRGLGDVYKRQLRSLLFIGVLAGVTVMLVGRIPAGFVPEEDQGYLCLLYTSDAADERSSVDLGGRRIIKKTNVSQGGRSMYNNTQKHRSTVRGNTIQMTPSTRTS